MAFIRKFKTTSGAIGVQVCYKEGERVVKTVHVGSASTDDALMRLLREAQGIIDGDKKPLFNLDKYNKK
ncbi:hypothetical protein IKF20_02100 [Candidatus Saccharibacteria bacterium]|nr:hypothetical protein [Candidatus Saccharibacteria bacterium]